MPDRRLVLALDVYERERALSVVDAASPYLFAVKINWPLVLGAGPDIINELASRTTVICDFKVADIPNTNRLIARQAFGRGGKYLIVQPFTGRDSLEACVEVGQEMGGEVLAVVEMSHPGGKEMYPAIMPKLCGFAKEAGAAGVIAPATRPERIAAVREIIGSDMKIYSPGVGAQGGKASDALRNGADYIIVGRAIYNAEDPAAAAKTLTDEIDEALAGI